MLTVGYLYPVIVWFDGSGFPLVLAVVLSFILPSLGYTSSETKLRS